MRTYAVGHSRTGELGYLAQGIARALDARGLHAPAPILHVRSLLRGTLQARSRQLRGDAEGFGARETRATRPEGCERAVTRRFLKNPGLARDVRAKGRRAGLEHFGGSW